MNIVTLSAEVMKALLEHAIKFGYHFGERGGDLAEAQVLFILKFNEGYAVNSGVKDTL